MSGFSASASAGGLPEASFLTFEPLASVTRQSATAAAKTATSAGQRRLDRGEHLGGGLDLDDGGAGRARRLGRAGDEGDAGAAAGERRGDGAALAAGRAVGDVAHRVDRLVGRPGGDEDVPARRAAAGEGGVDRGDDLRRLGHAAEALALDRGARILTIPSNFTLHTGMAHWEVLLRARAIENQAFVLATGQHGTPGELDKPSYGHSMIIDPWGTVLAQAPDGDGVIVADLDLAAQAAIRKRLPALLHIRPDLYQTTHPAHT